MALNFQTIADASFLGGIDSRSSENQIPEGYVKDIINGDILEGRVRKRRGYQGYSGNIPVRVTQAEYQNTNNKIIFTLPDSIDLSASYSSPLVIYGRTSSTITSGGPFVNTSDASKYYTGFTIESKKTLLTGTNTLSILNAEHGIDTTSIFCQVVESTSSLNRSHELVAITSIVSDESTYDLNLTYTNGSGASKSAYVYYKDRSASTGSVYIATLSHTGSGSETFNIPAATHALNNYNILVRCQVDLGTTRELVTPSAVEITSAGQVNITLNYGVATTFYAILSATTVTNYVSGTIAGSSTANITIPDITSPWIFLSVYEEQTPGGTKEEVLPNSITYDDTTLDLTVSFVNSTVDTKNFFIYYEYGSIRANRIAVDDSTISVDATDTRPQLTIWGLDHSEAYGTGTLSNREGWTTHIDAYKRSGESRLICGLGGNLFRSRTYSEDGTAYKYATLYPRLQARTASTLVLAPTFWTTGSTPARSRGYITGGNIDSGNKAVISAVNYDSGNTWTKYTLSVTSLAILDSSAVATTIGNVISTTTDLEDYITITQMSDSKHEGTFKIKQVTSGVNLVYIWVENSAIAGTDWDDTGVAGSAIITTDRLTFLASSPFITSDILTNSVISSNTLTVTVKGSSSTSTVSSGWTSTVTIPGGVVTTGQRTSSIISMRDALPSVTASVTNLVRGDMISYTGITRLLRVKSINPDTDRTVDITANGTAATVTLASGSTSALRVGGKILLYFAGVYTGSQTITEIPSTTTFKFATSLSTTVNSATLVGSTAEIDESLAWADTESDSKALLVERRWVPIEAPDDSYGLTPSTYVHHLDTKAYNTQNFLRSVMVMDNMYFTNQDDEVLKFDGTNISRAGIIPWQPGLFSTIDENASSKIIADNPSATPSAVNVNVFTLTAGDEKKFPIGSRVRHKYVGGYADYEVIDSYYPGTGSNGFVKVRKITTGSLTLGTTPTLTRLSSRRYYFRCNAIDANNNIVASAITSHQDFIVEIGTDAAINLKLVGLPVWDIYDYDRLEVEIYATLLGNVAPFYRLATLQMDFDNTQGYIQYTDVLSDLNLLELDQTSVLKQGGELGVAWSDPLRAKYTTSLGNKLVLGHVKDYPQLDLQLMADGSITDSVYAGKKFIFRRADTASGTVTDMLATSVYELVNGTTGDVSSISIGSDQFTVNVSGSTASIAAGDWIYLTYASAFPSTSTTSFTFEDADVNTGTEYITETAHGMSNGQQIRLTNSGGALPTGLSAGITYYVVGVTANTFQLSTTLGGSAVNITAAAGGGTHTVSLQGNSLVYSGLWQITSKSASSVTINLTGAASTTSYPDKYVLATDPTDIPVLLGTDGNLGMYNGNSLDTFDVTRRMSLALNSSMRMVDTTISGFTTFTPWMIARSGNDVGVIGRLIIRQPRSDSTTMELVLPSSFSSGSSSFTVFVNGVRQAVSASISASTRVYPSRILVSYDNYPELFDNPTAILDSESDSAIDINSADGQEITGVIPFFGESAFGAAQQSSILVVFKQGSIYLVDTNEKKAGRNPIQRIESEGLGCTAPYSIASTKNGIMFANESGMYCLRRNQSIQYIGKFMERKWVDTLNLNQLAIVQGHSYGLGRQYKVSIPLASAILNSDVYVYDHTAEAEGTIGSWSRYNNHAATGWANLAPEAYFCTSNGRVMILRRTGTIYDFRDDSSSVALTLETRPNAFGNPGLRKIIGDILVHYRVGARNVGTTLKTAMDTEKTYESNTAAILTTVDSGTYVAQDIVTLRYSCNRRRGIYIQVKIQNSTIDEDLEIAGVTFRVAGLSDKGISEVANSSSR